MKSGRQMDVEELAPARGAESERDSSPRVGLLDILIILFQRKFLILAIGVFSAVGAWAALLGVPDQFRAAANFVVAQKEQWDLDAFIVVSSGTGSIANQAYGFKNDPLLYTSILRTSAVTRNVARAIGTPEAEIERVEAKLRQNVEIEMAEEGVITVLATHENPELAAMIANAYRTELGRLSVRVNQQGLRALKDFLVRAKAQVARDLEKLEDGFQQEANDTGMIHIDQQSRATVQLDMGLRSQLATAQADLARLAVVFTEEHRSIREQRERIRGLEDALKELTRADDDGGTIGYRQLTDKRLRSERTQRLIQYKRELLNLLSNQLGVVELREDIPSSSIIPLDIAEAPMYAIAPKREKLIAAAGIAGLIIAALFAIWSHGFARDDDGEREIKMGELRRALFAIPIPRLRSRMS
jgi:uncharacterized protein involved in exopolysaccharide biosynthesis